MAPIALGQTNEFPPVVSTDVTTSIKGATALPSPSRRLHAGYSHRVRRRFCLPSIISDRADDMAPISSMPGQFRMGTSQLVPYLKPLVKNGLQSVLLFGVITNAADKDENGTSADDVSGPVISAVHLIRSQFPDLYVICDVCLCEYTSNGHCGVSRSDGSLDNTATLKRLVSVAQSYANAGTHCVAPSDMNDGRIGSIKKGFVDIDSSHQVSVMSYAAKFYSSMYGPFRQAADSIPAFGDRRCYQFPCGARGLASRAIRRDVDEGADFIIVKLAGNYLDIIRVAANICPDITIAAYQVSGEFSALHAASAAGVGNLRAMAFESCEAMMRSGANIIISYFTPEFLQWLPS